MSTLTGTLGHALLGVLAEGPRTGYALVRHLSQSIGYTWPARHSQVYPELAKLLAEGLIRESGTAPRGGRVYELTDTGLAEVRRWLREIHEEVGVPVRDVAYLGSQAWPFPRSLMVGFQAVADADAPLRPAQGEIAEAKWVTRAELRDALAAGDWAGEGGLRLPGAVSIARAMLEAWAAAG